jgi:hypothetical protein
MTEWLWIGLKWLLIVLAASPAVIGIGWSIVEGSILPRLIPREEIEATADDVMRRYPDNPEERAFIEEHAAWYRSLSFEQGKWHRVRKLIRKRLLSGNQSCVL